MEATSSVEQNKAIVKRLFQELDAFLEHDIEKAFKTANELIHDNCITYFAGHTLDGLDAYKEHLKGASASFYNMRHNIEDMIGEGNKVVTRVNFTAKHVGEFLGIKASGRLISTPIIYFHEMEDGMVTKCWLDWDSFFVMKLGLEATEKTNF